ncbi:TetR/AcrR family transcriptional regulator [Aquihabitans sp. McL0605]|uniref:TetR/AcrR family transcriptional regulator n=1 Tax=Aquihabitans sp. McL0605 TaxID=3415671 RepID=UPI003CF326A2
MAAAEPAPPSASALKLVVAAERLFALRGIEGVSLRQIAAEAGSANNSAVHYYFGSKVGLITAIFQHRLPQIISERRLLVAQCDRSDLRSRLEAQFLPVFAMADAADNHYISFVEQLQRHERGRTDDLRELPSVGQDSNDEFRSDLHLILGDLPEPYRILRIEQAQAFCVHAAADREHTVISGRPSIPFDLFVNSMFDGITGFLSAPESEVTRRKVGRVGDPQPPELRLL